MLEASRRVSDDRAGDDGILKARSAMFGSNGRYDRTMTMEPLRAFEVLDMRVGQIVRAEPYDAAREPSYKLWIDFGTEYGEKQSSAQLTDLYSVADLIGRRVIAAVNLGEKRIAGFKSQVLVLGVPDTEGRVVLLMPERAVPLGGRVY